MKRKKINWLEIAATGIAAVISLAILWAVYISACAALMYFKVA